MSTLSLPIVLIGTEGIAAIVGILLVLLIIDIVFGLALRKFKGRTWREFQSSANIWEILEQWAAIKEYKLVEQSEDSRTYQMRGLLTIGFIPKLQVTRTDGGYRLEVWMNVRNLIRIFPAMFYPHDIIIDVKSLWLGVDWYPSPRNGASMDVNALIDMIDAEIDPIP